MMGMKARFGIGAVTAALAVTAVAGCSGSGSSSGGSGVAGGTGVAKTGSGDSSVLSLVADAMNKANAAGTVKVTGTMTAPGVTTPITMTAQEQYTPSLEMSMSMQVEGQTMSEILVGDVVYMDYPALSSELGGKQWAEIDLAKANSLGSLSSLLDSARNENPTTQIAALVASGAVTKVGPATVNGQSTTHYTGTLDASQLLKVGTATSNLSASQLSSLKSELQTAGVTTVKIDLWIAANGLPVEEKYSEQTSAGAVSGDMFMSDWGTPVSVGAPPASEVYNMTNALNSAGASATASAAG
jgi:hypothetical protein